jgi:hypothetical protein
MLEILKATVTDGTGAGATTASYYFRGSEDVFEDTTIQTATGITEAADDEKDNPLYKVEELLRKGIIIRLAASLEDGDQVKLYCTRAKLNTALDLVGSTYDGQEITSVRIPLKATFY